MSSDFWSHVAHGSAIRLQAVDAFVCCEAEVSEFEVHFLVNKNVLEFNIPVNYTLFVHVFHSFDHLS